MLNNIKNLLRQLVEKFKPEVVLNTPNVVSTPPFTDGGDEWFVPNGEVFEIAGNCFSVFIERKTRMGVQPGKFAKIGQTFHNLAPRNPRGLSQHGKFIR